MKNGPPAFPPPPIPTQNLNPVPHSFHPNRPLSVSMAVGARGVTSRPTPPANLSAQPSFTQKLPVLDRANKDLISIDKDICDRDWLTKLYLFQNRITAVPPEIKNLKNLTVLDLSYNRLTSLPPESCELTMREELLLVGCRLALFPKGMEKLKSLKKIDLTSNKMVVFFQEITVVSKKNQQSQKNCRKIFFSSNPRKRKYSLSRRIIYHFFFFFPPTKNRDQLGGKLASSWQKEAAVTEQNPTRPSRIQQQPGADSTLSPPTRTKRDEIASSLVGKLLRRPSINSLRRRHILVDGDPTFHARKMALKHLLIEKTLNDQLSRKYEQALKVETTEEYTGLVQDSGLSGVVLEGLKN